MKPSPRKQLRLRSIFTSGVNLGNQIHRPSRGKGSYTRKDRYNRWN